MHNDSLQTVLQRAKRRNNFFFHHLVSVSGDKSPPDRLRSPLTRCECFGMLCYLSVPQGPQVFQARHPDPPKSCAWLFLMDYL